MLFRRVAEHVRTQNWTAIGIDFLIVVVGVFLGIQLGNWNEGRKEQAEYADAVERLDREMTANVAAFDAMDARLIGAIGDVRKGVDALNTCDGTPENRSMVNAALKVIIGTEGFHVRDTALRELTSDPALLRHQSSEVRSRLSDLQFTTDIAISEGQLYEAKPLETDVAALAATGIGERHDRPFPYFDADRWRVLKSQSRPELSVSFAEACRDNELLAALWTWERYQANMPIMTEVLRREYAETRQTLDLPAPE